MTGLLQEKELSRRSFIKGGGALIVAFSVAGSAVAGKASAGVQPAPQRPADGDPFDSYGPYDPEQIDSWLVVHSDNTVSLKLGKVNLGTGSNTGLMMIAADELDVGLNQMKKITNDTNVTPDQGTTAGSSSVQGGGMQTRAAAAAGKQALLALASTRLGVPVTQLSVNDGVVSGGGKTVSYGELLGEKRFNVTMTPKYNMARTRGGINGTSGVGLALGAPGTKTASQYKVVMTSPPRLDIPEKIIGTYTYVQNIRVPGMLHGRIVRPRGQGAYGNGTNPQVLSIDERSIAHIPGAQVVRRGNFVGVVAPKEWNAIEAAALLKVTWAAPPVLPTDGDLFETMRTQDSAGQVEAVRNVEVGNVDSALAGAAHVVQQTYKYHYNAHVPIGPECVVADVTPHGAVLYSNTQNAYGTRTEVQGVLDPPLPIDKIRIIYYEGSSVYGGAPYNDCACSAAVMSQLVGKPVRLQFMRWDEHGWDNYGPAQMVDARGGVSPDGTILATDYTGFQIPYYTTDASEQMIGQPTVFSTRQSADTTNTGTQYNLPNRRVTSKILPLANNYFKTIYLRAPLAPQSLFAYEQLIDELAHAAKMDPYEFRLQNITSNAAEASRKEPYTWGRWKNVLTAVAKMANWQPKVAASKLSSGRVATGRGIAIGSFAGTMAGIVADVEVNMKTGKISVPNLYGAQDTGLTVYPGGVELQAVGSMTQGLSRALHEEVTFDKARVTSLDWIGYPILRFMSTPKIHFQVLQRTDIPAVQTGTVAADGMLATGSGEPPTAPIAAAVANGFFDATGVRIREAPMTAARVRAVLRAAKA